MQYAPHKYQIIAYDHVMQQPRSALFLDMGLGKTVVTLTAINDLMYDFFEVKRVLVIAPLRVAEDTWDRECRKWDHLKKLKISKVLGDQEHRVKALLAKADIYLINRENVEWLVNYYLKKWPFDMVVVDELSSFKSSKSKRFKSLKRVMPLTDRFIGLTGTPAPNGLIDLWPQVYLMDRGVRLGRTATMFKDRYFSPGWRNGNIVYKWNIKPGAEEDIYSAIGDICMSLKAEDWLSVPERIDSTFYIDLPVDLRTRYRDFERDSIMQLIDQDIVASTAAVVTNKLLQFSNGAVYDDERHVHEIHKLKLEALEELLEQANGKPVMVFYSFIHDFDRITAYLKKYSIRTIENSQDIQDWNEGKIEVLLVHPASVGHGLNLQDGGNIIIWFGLTYSLELYMQANARLHRQGQKQKVQVHHILCRNTIDEEVMRALELKDVNQARLIDAVKARISDESNRTAR